MRNCQAIEIRNLYYTYPDGTQALKDVNLTVENGESVAIIGPNGAGKSTLLLHLNGILKGEGEVRIFGLSVSNSNIKEVRRRVGLVFQDPDDQLFCPSVFDDVAFGPMNMGLPRDEVVLRTKMALGAVGLPGFEKKLGYHLSFGQKKQAAIATVLSMQPDILAIDEPSSNLDPRSRRKLINVLRPLPVTKVIVTHDLSFVAKVCKRVVILDAGEVAAEGELGEIFSDEALLEKHGLERPASY